MLITKSFRSFNEAKKKPAPLTVRAPYQTYMETHSDQTAVDRIAFKETSV